MEDINKKIEKMTDKLPLDKKLEVGVALMEVIQDSTNSVESYLGSPEMIEKYGEEPETPEAITGIVKDSVEYMAEQLKTQYDSKPEFDIFGEERNYVRDSLAESIDTMGKMGLGMQLFEDYIDMKMKDVDESSIAEEDVPKMAQEILEEYLTEIEVSDELKRTMKQAMRLAERFDKLR